MARTKKLTESQVAALTRLTQGTADFFDLRRAGSTGATSAWLVAHGLAVEVSEGGKKLWQITNAGTSALTAGRIMLS